MLAPGDPAWDDLWRLELSGALPAGITSTRSVSRGEAAAWIANAERDPRADPASLERLKRAFARELRREGTPISVRETRPAILLRGENAGASARDAGVLDGARSELRLGPTAGVQGHAGDGGREKLGDSTRVGIYGVYLISDRAALQGEIFVGHIPEGRSIGDPLINHTDILYFSEDAGATFATRELRMRFARARHHWGAGPGGSGSLLLDQRAQPIDHFEWNLDLPAGIRFVSWTGVLNAYEKRGIAAHRLDVPLGRNLRVALSEGVRYQGGFGDPLYVLGLLPYTLVQRLDEQDTRLVTLRKPQRNNVLADAEIVWRPRPGGIVYGEMLVDDLPAATGHNPARIGARIGISAMPRVAGAPLEVDLEGTKVGRYVYAVAYDGGCECDWIHQGDAIGSPDGPDQEALRLRAVRSLGCDHRIEIELLYANRGAGRLGEAWVERAGNAGGTRRALEVSPPVERDRRLTAVWRWAPRDNFFLETSTGAAVVRNAANRATGDGYRSSLDGAIRAGWRL